MIERSLDILITWALGLSYAQDHLRASVATKQYHLEAGLLNFGVEPAAYILDEEMDIGNLRQGVVK